MPNKKYKSWKRKISKYKKLDIDNDNTYDYEGFYNENPNEAWNMLKKDEDAHFTDRFKTVYHPTFSIYSKYSGVKHPIYNPNGFEGGKWLNDDTVFEEPEFSSIKRNERASYILENDNDVKYIKNNPKNGIPLGDSFNDEENEYERLLPTVEIKPAKEDYKYKYGGQMKSKFNRPRAFWGALIGSVIGAGASLINGHKQKKAQERALYNQRSEENRQNEMQAANNMIGLLNNNAIENEYDDKLEFKYGGRKHCDFGSEINNITSPALNALTSIAINSNTNNNDARFNIPQTFYDRNYTKMIYNKFNKAKYGCFKARH